MARYPRAQIVILVVVSVITGCRRAAPEPETADTEIIVPVTAREAALGSLRAVIHTTGIVTPAQGAEFVVTAPETARIIEMPRSERETVASGDILVRFDLTGAAANVARQRAELAGAQALAENARAAQTRTRDFVERGLVARQEMDRADRELADAQTAVARAETALNAAEASAARAIVRAPLAGVVVNRLKNPGDVASTQEAVLRLVDPRRMEVTASIRSADVARVLQGATARLLAGAAVVRLTVTSRPGSVDARTNTASARLAFVEPPAAVAVDQAVEVDIDAEERVNVVFVPAEALIRTGRETAVYVAVGDKAERRSVTIGVETDERAEVTSGVKAGELVITQGHIGLADGARVSVSRF